MTLSIILVTLSAIANAVMDKVSFHHSKSIFSDWSNWWNPKESHKYKWKNGDKEQGEKFPLSSTLLVSLTDGWHAMKFVMRWAMLGAVISYGVSGPQFGYIWDAILLGFMQIFTFGLFYTYIFTKRKQTNE